MKQLEKFKELYPEYAVVFFHISGSRLYGTELPNSDTDYRGVFIPPLKDLVMKTDIEQWTSSTGNKTKNGTDDIDITLWSIHKFIKLLGVGDTNAFDTLFAYQTPSELLCTQVFVDLFDEREVFYPKSLRSFFGYALGQVKMYSVKGDKLQDILLVKSQVQALLDGTSYEKLKDIKEHLPISNNLKFIEDDTTEYYQVLDKKFITNIRLSEFMEKILEMESKYGSRAKASMENKLVDWKAMYHAFRVLLECSELMRTGNIQFPLAYADFLLLLRKQEIGAERAFSMLEDLYNEVSDFEKTDGNFLNHIKQDPSRFKEILWRYLELAGQLETNS
jgi:predicted nucleotidyltransferase